MRQWLWAGLLFVAGETALGIKLESELAPDAQVIPEEMQEMAEETVVLEEESEELAEVIREELEPALVPDD